MLENVTVIIPAHNRPERLRRLIDYYASSGVKLLIPDSSNEAYAGPMNPEYVTYRHFPREHMLVKVREVMDLITTDYVLYCADDDFAVPEGIASVVNFLEQHPDYCVAQGHYLTFTPGRNGRITFYPRYIRNFNNCVGSDDPLERLAAEKSLYASLLYGVTRTETFKRIYSYCFDESGELRYRNLFLAEEFFNCAMLIQGKYATIPCFFSARERIKGSATDTTVPLSVIMNSPEYAAEYAGFKEALALMLSDVTGMPHDDALRHIDRESRIPVGSSQVVFKRRVNAFLSRHRCLHWAAALSEWRYHQKGLRAVKGMPSYPCRVLTPEINAIVRAVNSRGF